MFNMVFKLSPGNSTSPLHQPVSSVFCEWYTYPVLRSFLTFVSSLAVVTLVLPHYFNALAKSGYANKGIRRLCSDYGMPLTIIAMTGLAYWGRFHE
jgi:hypothetical protein